MEIPEPNEETPSIRPSRARKHYQELPMLRYEDPQLPPLEPPNRPRAIWRAKKLLSEVIYDITALEGNPHTVPEIATVLEGITVGGHRIEDQEQVRNVKSALDLLFELSENFEPSAQTAKRLQALAAKGEALEEGVFRSGPVGIAGTQYRPPEAGKLSEIYEQTLQLLKGIEHPLEQGIVMFLTVARAQFFWDGNKRTGRLLMNGILLREGQDLITIPAKQALEFNQKMLAFYESGDGSEMMQMLQTLQIKSRFS